MAGEHTEVDLVPDLTVEHLAKAVLIAALMAVLSQVSIDLPGGIPFSFQHFAVFLAGLVLGPVWGGFSLGVYTLTGIAGAPVFSNGGAGWGYFVGPTGGFIVGFVVAATVVGAIIHRRVEPRPLESVSAVAVVLAFVFALVPIYGIGIPWFAHVQGWTLARAAEFMSLFIVGDLIKVGVSAVAVLGGAELLTELE